jgi:hypothetical protein
MATFASEAWIDAWWAALRGDERVRDAAATWVFGPWLLVIEADAEQGLPEPVAISIDVHEGEVRDLRLAARSDARHAPWTFTAPYARWKGVFEGTVDLLDAGLGGRVRITGDLPELHRHGVLVAAIFAAASTLETTFPEPAAGEPAGAGAR